MIKTYNFDDRDNEIKRLREDLCKMSELMRKYVSTVENENKVLLDFLIALKEENERLRK
jgi:hypothetical protein